MKIQSTLQFLGTGGSMGIPIIGCDCSVCSSNDPRNKRYRSSALLTVGDKKILIDCGPDFHQQALQFKIHTLDGVILTHAHHDHTAGIDELRIYHMRSRKLLPLLLSHATYTDIKQRFNYIFAKDDTFYKLTAKFEIQVLEGDRGATKFLGMPLSYFSYEQARMQVNGFRFGNLAYITDIHDYSDTIFDEIKGIDVLVLSALRFTPSPLHLSLDEAIEFAKRTSAKQTWLIHIAHEMEHERSNTYLPENIQLAYDGLLVNFVI